MSLVSASFCGYISSPLGLSLLQLCRERVGPAASNGFLALEVQDFASSHLSLLLGGELEILIVKGWLRKP